MQRCILVSQTLTTGRTNTALRLIDAGFPINVHQDNDGQTPLHRAVRNNNLDMVRLFVARGAKVDATSKDGDTALFWAVGDKKPQIVQFLLDAGANIDHLNEKNQSALFSALEKANLVVLKLLIERGADVTVEDKDGHTALYYAELSAKHSYENQEGIDSLKAAEALAKKSKK